MKIKTDTEEAVERRKLVLEKILDSGTSGSFIWVGGLIAAAMGAISTKIVPFFR